MAFYERLGLTLAARWENGAEYVGRQVGYPGVNLRIAVLTIPGSEAVLELLQYEGVDGEPIDPATANPGTGHFCLLVDDLEALYDELKDEIEFISAPQTPTLGPNEGGRVVYLKDPDGFRVELHQTPSTMTGELRWGVDNPCVADEWSRHLPAGAPAPTLAGEDESLATAFRALWDADPSAVAVADLTGEAEEQVLTRGELDRHSAGAAALLAERGVEPGDRVLLSGAPSLPYLLLYVGALRLGATIVPANTGYTGAELGHLVSDSGATHAVVDDPARVAALALPTLVPDLAAIESAGAAPPLDRVGSEELAMIAYTSGTTGRPKGAMLSHRNLLASARAVALSWRWSSDDGLVLALPLFHLHGLGVGLHGSLVTGGRILLLAGFSAEKVVAAARRPDATMFFGVPTMHKRLVELAASDPEAAAALGDLRLIVSGSAPLPEELWRRIAAVTGQQVLERYGMTETVMNISNPFDGERRPGTVGLPLPGVEVSFAGGGDEGEILVRGPNVFAGYYRQPDATRESFTADGWFRTGDIGRRSADGYISIVGRSKELIISGGYNVYPREVEEVLELHDGVAEAVVVGRPSEEWGEQVTAFVVARDPERPPPADELTALAESRLAAYKKPREFRFVAAIPRNALGKVERHRLTVELT